MDIEHRRRDGGMSHDSLEVCDVAAVADEQRTEGMSQEVPMQIKPDLGTHAFQVPVCISLRHGSCVSRREHETTGRVTGAKADSKALHACPYERSVFGEQFLRNRRSWRKVS